ncbi:ion transporter [Pedobacter changchengzhani]|uniref:Ion transporter n=1 Tax=Pedobacter changchengzhani TaxID=2529274 RepID=A0A4V3A0I5_9SPHI|nr:ion transporter [Pedobacter changchengzhani]TDG37223.1 ion transporter [Pedobacter changchengzhani]
MRERINNIIFNHDTKAGRLFDVVLLWVILFSVLVVILESTPTLHVRFFNTFYYIEWGITIVFTIEYLLRIWSTKTPLKYIFSFWGLVDFISTVPTYLELLNFGFHYLLAIRIFRLLRVFRIFKLVKFSRAAQVLVLALKGSGHKIGVFLMAVFSIMVLLGTLMYVIEGGENGFTSIPQSIYWAVVTVTTVGFGDIVPSTVLGKILSSLAMIMGYAIIAVPTGIITVEMTKKRELAKICEVCNHDNPDDANFCNQCGFQF